MLGIVRPAAKLDQLHALLVEVGGQEVVGLMKAYSVVFLGAHLYQTAEREEAATLLMSWVCDQLRLCYRQLPLYTKGYVGALWLIHDALQSQSTCFLGLYWLAVCNDTSNFIM